MFLTGTNHRDVCHFIWISSFIFGYTYAQLLYNCDNTWKTKIGSLQINLCSKPSQQEGWRQREDDNNKLGNNGPNSHPTDCWCLFWLTGATTISFMVTLWSCRVEYLTCARVLLLPVVQKTVKQTGLQMGSASVLGSKRALFSVVTSKRRDQRTFRSSRSRNHHSHLSCETAV